MKNKGYIKWIVSVAIAIAIFIIYIIRMDIFNAESDERIYLVLTNAFFLDGVLMIGFGGLLFVSNEGMFDIFVYGMQSFINLFKKDKSKMKYATFYDYREAHKEQKISFLHLIIIGAILIGLMFIFLSLYHNVA